MATHSQAAVLNSNLTDNIEEDWHLGMGGEGGILFTDAADVVLL